MFLKKATIQKIQKVYIIKWLIRNWMRIVGIIMAIVIASYFYNKSQKKRELIYYINPVRSIVLQHGRASNLRVLHNNQEIKSDVTAVQIAIWNAGNESIRKENILSEVYIVTEPKVPILEATIRKQSRDIIEFLFSDSLFPKGIVSLIWKILEKNDGAVIELIYAGSPEVNIFVRGIIEGQSKIVTLKSSEKIKSPSEQIAEQRKQKLIIFWGAFFLSIIYIFYLIVVVLRKNKYKKQREEQLQEFEELEAQIKKNGKIGEQLKLKEPEKAKLAKEIIELRLDRIKILKDFMPMRNKTMNYVLGFLIGGLIFIIILLFFWLKSVPPSGPPFGF